MSGMWIFLGLVFLSVFLLTQVMTIPVFGENRKLRKRLLARLEAVSAASAAGRLKTLLREKYLKELTPLEQSLEALPGMETLALLIEQSGRLTPAYRVVLKSLALGLIAGVLGLKLTQLWYVAVLLAALGLLTPVLVILRNRTRRQARFEEQLPEALDVIKRALRAGHPFTQCLKLIADDMDEPISREFGNVFQEISYGSDLRTALMGLLERIPSVSAMAFITAVLVQKETGGNLAETLERITAVIRGRFKLHRQVRTLSAEGRLSAWVLMLIPPALFVVIWFTTPSYLPTLIHDPHGPNIITGACVLEFLGMLWIRRIIRIQV
jgi:tight adherence protein B